MRPDPRETREAVFPGLRIGRNHSGHGPHGDQLDYCSQLYNFEFWLLNFLHFYHPVALWWADFWVWLLCCLLSAGISIPPLLWVSSLLKIPALWVTIPSADSSLFVSVSSQLQLSHSPWVTSWPPYLSTAPNGLTVVCSLYILVEWIDEEHG